MNGQHDAGEEAKKWIDKAEHDIIAAKHTVSLAEAGLTDIICFHCQQCAEKYLKALLVLNEVHFPKTHDLRTLLELAQRHCRLELKLSDVVPLNRYTIEGRYPGDWEPISKEEALNAIKLASSVRDSVRALFPYELT